MILIYEGELRRQDTTSGFFVQTQLPITTHFVSMLSALGQELDV